MSRFWNLLCGVHSLAGPILMLLYPLYASVMAIESPSKVDDEQWLAYWILYSFLTLTEMVLQSVLEWIPIWYTVKLVLVTWLVLPQFRGAAFIYERFVREKIKQYRGGVKDHHQHHHKSSPSGKGKNKFVDFITPKERGARGILSWWRWRCFQNNLRFVGCINEYFLSLVQQVSDF